MRIAFERANFFALFRRKMERPGYPGFWMQSTKSKYKKPTQKLFMNIIIFQCPEAKRLIVYIVFSSVPEAAAERGEGGCLHQAAPPTI